MPAPEPDFYMATLYALMHIGQALVLLPLYFGFRYWHVLSPALRAMQYCCLMWTVMMLTAEICGRVYCYNIALWQLVDILDVWFIGAAYYFALHLRIRRYFLPIGIFYTLFALYDMFVLNDLWRGILEGLQTTNNYTLVVKHILLVSMFLLYFEQSLRHLRNVVLERDPMFVVSVALLIYFAGSFVMFIVASDMTSLSLSMALVTPILTALNLMLNPALARAFWLAGRPVVPAIEPLLPLGSSALSHSNH